MLGIDYPIIQGGMQWLSRAELASAVSNAGGLGILTAATHETKEALRNEIRKTRSLTSKPFAVNLAFYTRTPDKTHEDIDVVIEESIPVVETATRSPEAYIERLKNAGIKVIHKVVSIKHAQSAESYGVDAVIMVGSECGGYLGADEVTNLIQIPLASDLLKIPVIAGGGIGDARGFLAALALGADGVLIGTRFMATDECPAHPNFKRWLLQARETDTIVVGRTFGRKLRVFKNKLAEELLDAEGRGIDPEDALPMVAGSRARMSLQEGHLDDGVVTCGQVVGLIQQITSVKEVIDNMVTGAAALAGRLSDSAQL
jgi:nitronate monooxygenase